jgi:hypothetical protein
MTKKPLRLVERLKERAASRKPKPLGWFGRLPIEYQKEFSDARAAWQAGEIRTSCLQLARELVEECRAAGIEVPGLQGLRNWLSKG